MTFHSQCGNPHCNGGQDCHPDLMNAEVEALYWRCDEMLECCRWSIHNAFENALTELNGARPAIRMICPYGDQCYQKNPEHLINFVHPHDRDPTYKPREGDPVFDPDAADG